MKRFSLVRPTTLAAAQQHLLDDPAAHAFRAGGIDLLDRMKEGLDEPAKLVELGALGDDGARMRGISSTKEGHFAIGSLVTLAQLADYDGLPAGLRAVQEAAGSAATAGIREAATVGGNLLQRPRCWYYRHKDLVCLKKGGSVCYAVSGENRLHSIFGGGPSYIVHPSSLGAALVALDARVSVAEPGGTSRIMPIDGLFQLPSKDPTREHTLAPGEVVLQVILPAPVDQQRSAYTAAREKQSHDWPLAEAAARVAIRDGVMHDVRLAMGHVAPIPWRLHSAEKALTGKKPTAEVFATAAELATAGAQPLRSNGYKVALSRGLVRQALHRATDVPLPD